MLWIVKTGEVTVDPSVEESTLPVRVIASPTNLFDIADASEYPTVTVVLVLFTVSVPAAKTKL
jgi:hypothetical protein